MSAMRIFDGFSFYNELDILEIRLNLLWDVVDRFILVEATRTHTGKPKPLYFAENRARFARFEEKIVHVVVDDFPEVPSSYSEQDASWMREDWQRNAIFRGLEDAKDEDLLMISDVDEIPRPEVIARLCRRGVRGVVALEMEVFCYYLNYKNYTHYEITASKVVPVGMTRNGKILSRRINLSRHDPIVNRGVQPTTIRCMIPDRVVSHAGWHFSYLGGAEAIVRKIGSIAIEYANEKNTDVSWVKDVIAKGEDITGCGGRYFAVPLTAPRYPKYLLDHRSRYSNLIWNVDETEFRRTRFARLRCFVRGWIRKNGAKLIPRPWKQFLYDHVYCKLVSEPIVM